MKQIGINLRQARIVFCIMMGLALMTWVARGQQVLPIDDQALRNAGMCRGMGVPEAEL